MKAIKYLCIFISLSFFPFELIAQQIGQGTPATETREIVDNSLGLVDLAIITLIILATVAGVYLTLKGFVNIFIKGDEQRVPKGQSAMQLMLGILLVTGGVWTVVDRVSQDVFDDGIKTESYNSEAFGE